MVREPKIMFVNQPVFRWDGSITDNDKAPIKCVNTYQLNENFTLIDFLVEHKGRTVVFFPNPDNGGVIHDFYRIRAYIE